MGGGVSKPSAGKCAALVSNGQRSARVAQYGSAPLLYLWVHEDGHGGHGIVLDVDQAIEIIDGLNDIIDDIEGVSA